MSKWKSGCMVNESYVYDLCKSQKYFAPLGKHYYEVSCHDQGLCRVGWSSMQASLDLGKCFWNKLSLLISICEFLMFCFSGEWNNKLNHTEFIVRDIEIVLFTYSLPHSKKDLKSPQNRYCSIIKSGGITLRVRVNSVKLVCIDTYHTVLVDASDYPQLVSCFYGAFHFILFLPTFIKHF